MGYANIGNTRIARQNDCRKTEPNPKVRRQVLQGCLSESQDNVWRIAHEGICNWLDLQLPWLLWASLDFEFALHRNGVRQGAVNALTVYVGNGSRPMSDAFANCPIYHGHLAYFVATPLLPLTKPLSVKFRLTIRRSLDEMIVNSPQSAWANYQTKAESLSDQT